MNYYEHHIGDYATATKHLSWDEDMAYTRLIRLYYEKEQPIPADLKKACRLVCATSKLQREAVETVLEEFFELREDGWHQQVCDENISRYLEGEPEREVKKANERNRNKDHRDQRSRLFKALTDAGLHAPWNIPIGELRAMVAGISGTGPATQPATPATAPATPATATQSPDTNTQSPLPTQNPVGTTNAVGITPRDASAEVPARASPAELSAAMRRHSISAQPADPRVIAAAEAGITVATIEAVCLHVKEKKPNENIGSGYVLATAKGWIADASKPAVVGTASTGRRQTSQDARLAQSAANVASWLADEPPPVDDRTIENPV